MDTEEPGNWSLWTRVYEGTEITNVEVVFLNNSHPGPPSPPPGLSMKPHPMVLSVYTLVQAVGLSLNIFISLFLCKSRVFRNSATMVLLNLAFVDILHCLLLSFPIATIASRSLSHTNNVCIAYGFLFHLLASVSLNNIAAIAIER